MAKKKEAESTIREIRRKASKTYSAEEKIRIVLDDLREEDSTRKRSENAVFSLAGTSKDGIVLPRSRTGAKTWTGKNRPTTKAEAWQTQAMY